MPGPGIKVKPKAASVGVVRNTAKQTVLSNLVNDRTGRSTSTDAGKPRPEQDLMNESLQVPHPFEKGKTLGWGEFKGLAKTQATRFRDMGIMLTGKGLRWWELESTRGTCSFASEDVCSSHLPQKHERLSGTRTASGFLDLLCSHSFLSNVDTSSVSK